MLWLLESMRVKINMRKINNIQKNIRRRITICDIICMDYSIKCAGKIYFNDDTTAKIS